MGFKGKFLTVLIVYFAGFATAIYALAPANQRHVAAQETKKPVSFPQSFTKSDQFAAALGQNMRKCVAATKQMTAKASESMNQKQAGSGLKNKS